MINARLLWIVGLAAAAAGCSDLSVRHGYQAEAASSAGRYQECIEHATAAIDMVRGDRKNNTGILNLKTVSPGDNYRIQFFKMLLGQDLAIRADCEKRSGRLPEAVADMEKATEAYADACRRKALIQENSVCKASADATENLARWKKELAAADKK